MTSSGRIEVSKHCQDALPPSVPSEAYARISGGECEPIFELTGDYLCVWTYGSDPSVLYLTVSAREADPVYLLTFMRRLDRNMRMMLSPVRDKNHEKDPFDSQRLHDKRSVVVQILEEVLDGGYVTNMDTNCTATLIPQLRGGATGLNSALTASRAIKMDTASELLPREATSPVRWRRAGVYRSQNAIYFDVIEAITATFKPDGTPMLLNLQGRIRVSCYVSGMPEVEMHVSDPQLLKGSTVHPCVRSKRLERNGVLSFIPPDGEFDLCRYTCQRLAASRAVPLRVVPRYSMSNSGNGVLCVDVSPVSADVPVSDVVLDIVLPHGIIARDIQQTSGARRAHIYYDQEASLIKVSVGHPVPLGERARPRTVDLDEPGIPELVTNSLKMGDHIVIQCQVQDKLFVPASCILDENGGELPGDQHSRTMPSPFRPTIMVGYSLPRQTASGLSIRSVEVRLDPDTEVLLKGEKPFRGSRSISIADDVVFLC